MRMFTEPGRRVLPHCTAVGKALLAELPTPEVQRIVSQPFQAFASFDDAFTSYARLLATSRFYAQARDSSDIDGFAKGLAPYATDTDYTASLIRDYLKPYDLYKYDQCEIAAVGW